ncbi:MAG TPA: TonB-dependent receptor [Gemmatimonadales bacterium]|nr:TonB-dependent receptor [Gemmatimonadales bacterium]
MRRLPRAALTGLVLLWPVAAPAQTPEPGLSDLDIEELGRIPVTSAARHPQPLASASAAIFVITREDIRRAGATSVPDALRLAPGLQVAQVTARDWSITARGFAEHLPNKLLVLIDGRAVYSPLFSGVFWDVQQVPLDDIDRIEVILGPGATLWGSNAMNGVINVITRSSAVTRGGLVQLRSGTSEHAGGSARYGFRVGARSTLRVYAMGSDQEPSDLADGTEAEDNWRLGQGGFRFDGAVGERDLVSVQGDAYLARGDQLARQVSLEPPYTTTVTGERKVDGGNLLARWTRTLSEASSIQVQAYYDRATRDQPPTTGRVTVDIGDVEFQHHFSPWQAHAVVWGAGYRLVADALDPTFGTSLRPASRTTSLVTAFAQDEIALVPARLTATLGLKLERNDLSGLEWQPNVRLLWSPLPGQTLWASAARAVRVPSRLDTDVTFVAQVIPGSPTTLLRIEGNEEFDSEALRSAEVGWRAELGATVSADVSAYHSWYDRLRSTHPAAPYAEDTLRIQPVSFGNDAEGRAWGGTAALNWRLHPRVLLRGSYTRLEMRINARDDAPSGSTPNVDPGFNPEQFASLFAFADLPGEFELHLGGRYVGALASPLVEEYVEAGAHLAWRPRAELMISLRGENLLHARHAEFSSAPTREMPRRAEVHVSWGF